MNRIALPVCRKERRGGRVGKGGEWKRGDRRETEMQLYRRGKVFPGSSINRRDIAEMSKGDASNGALSVLR